ncbi:MAG: hypothetical protein ACLVKT_14835 [Intestinibacter bartlettii]|uniref:hypothetical protein n=1 Tax=Intestinibacter bartlettii TaxID=261299 RepID=UPI00399B81FE
MKPTIIAPVLSKEEFIQVLILEALKLQDYLDEVDPEATRVITKRNLLEALIYLYKEN